MTELVNQLKNLTLGEPSIISNLIVFPVTGEPLENGKIIVLDEAGDEIEVEELLTPTVGKVKIKNFSDSHFFGIEGEEILGALQHRIFVTSFLLPGKSERIIPVSCVEEGRWSGEKEFFSGATIAYPTLRAITSSSVYQNLVKGKGVEVDQKTIWKEIERKQTTLKTHSKTRSMHDTYLQLKEELSYFSDYSPLEKQVGLLAMTNRRVLCADIFLNPELFRKFMRKLLISYALDAIEDSLTPSSFEIEKGKEFFSSMIKIRKAKKFAGLGLGDEWRFREKGIIGKGLSYEEKIYHLSIFPIK
ncbi:MAG: ARPP-1 family domain-containing protein [Candidatus Aminicenantia bacterium]